MEKSTVWFDEAWKKSKQMMVENYIQALLKAAAGKGSVHIITAPGSVCECGDKGGMCIEVIARRIVELPEVKENL